MNTPRMTKNSSSPKKQLKPIFMKFNNNKKCSLCEQRNAFSCEHNVPVRESIFIEYSKRGAFYTPSKQEEMSREKNEKIDENLVLLNKTINQNQGFMKKDKTVVLKNATNSKLDNNLNKLGGLNATAFKTQYNQPNGLNAAAFKLQDKRNQPQSNDGLNAAAFRLKNNKKNFDGSAAAAYAKINQSKAQSKSESMKKSPERKKYDETKKNTEMCNKCQQIKAFSCEHDVDVRDSIQLNFEERGKFYIPPNRNEEESFSE